MGWGSGVAVSCGLGHRRLRSHAAVAVVKAGSCSSDSTPNLGTSMCCGCSPKKKQNKQANNNNKPSKIILDLYNVEMMSFAANTFGLHCTIYSRTDCSGTVPCI